MSELVSIIITTYKGSKSLSRAINSALGQTYPHIEIVVVDDNGVDSIDGQNTNQLMNRYQNKVRYVRHEKNKNGAAARNTGMKIANGAYICFLDDDDLMVPTRIEKCVNALKECPQYHAVLSDVLYTDENLVPMRIIKVRKEGDCTREILLNSMFLGTGSNLFFTRQACQAVGEFDERFRRHQDLEYMLRFYRKFKSCIVDELLVVKSKNGVNNIPRFIPFKQAKTLFYQQFEHEIQALSPEEQGVFWDKQKRELRMAYFNTPKTERGNEKYTISGVGEFLRIIMYGPKLRNTTFFQMINKVRKKKLQEKLQSQIGNDMKAFLEKQEEM